MPRGSFCGLFACCQRNVEDIRELVFSHNSLKEVPSSVFAHERTLEELHLESNRIFDLPRALFHCHELRYLNLSDNDLKTLPPAIASLINLQHLNLSKNMLHGIPDNIKGCKQLIYVNVSVNPLDKLPEGITQLPCLEELYLNDTFIEYLPANFGRLSRLRVLDVRENNLNLLPKSISRLANLQILDIGSNEFSDLPEVIGDLPELLEIWADGNKIRSIPSWIGNLTKLINIDVSNNNIQWVAPEIQLCSNLTYLILTRNELTSLPDEICNLKNLSMLNVDDNDIGSLPRAIGQLAKLEELVVSCNSIEALPPTIGLLRKVTIINADNNRLSELPSELCSCSSLRVLSVRKNRLVVMPAEIGHLTAVRVINLSDNMLRNLPVSILNLTNLKALWLSINQSTPLTTLQQEIDPKTGLMVCVNFMFPQEEQERKMQLAFDEEPIPVERPSRPRIRFADNIDLNVTSRLTRAPTPYPKELRSMAKHARILTTKPLKMQLESDEEMPLLDPNNRSSEMDATDWNASVKTATNKPTIAQEMEPLTSQHQACQEDLSPIEDYKPDIPPSYEKKVEPAPPGDQYPGLPAPNLYGVGENVHMIGDHAPGIPTAGITSALILASKSEVCELAVSRPNDGLARNEVALPALIPSLSMPESGTTHFGSLLAGQPKPQSMEDIASETNLTQDVGFNGDLSSNGNPTFANGADLTGFSPTAQVKVPPPYHIAAIHSKQAAYFMTSPNGQGITESLQAETADLPLPPTAAEIAASVAVQPGEEGGTVPEDVSTRAHHTSYSNMLDLMDNLPHEIPVAPVLDKSPRSPVSKCNIPVLRAKEGAASGIPKPQVIAVPDEFLPRDKNAVKMAPPRPRESVSKIPSFSSKEPKVPVAKKPSGIPSGNSSTKLLLPGFHSASHLPHPKSSAVAAFPEPFPEPETEPEPEMGSPTNGNRPEPDEADLAGTDNGNGNAGGAPSETGLATPGFKSRIPARVSPVKGSTTPNSPTSPIWVFGQHKNPTVFPLTLVKNPGLGFSISGGTATPDKPDSLGIYISKVQPNGPAGGALMIGDKILEVDGVDFSKLEHDQAVGILKQTKNVVQMMVSRQK